MANAQEVLSDTSAAPHVCVSMAGVMAKRRDEGNR